MEERICALCGKNLSEEDKGHILKEGRLVCSSCFQFDCGKCDYCREYFAKEELTNWGDDVNFGPRRLPARTFRATVTEK